MNLSTQKASLWLERIITWGLPMAVIPVFRYMQDADKPQKERNELFVRDSSSYAVGTGIYFSTLAGASKIIEKGSKLVNKNPELASIVDKSKNFNSIKNLIKKIPNVIKKQLPVISAVSTYCLWCGFCGPKFSKMMFKENKQTLPTSKSSVINQNLKNRNINNKNINFNANIYKNFTKNNYSRANVFKSYTGKTKI